MTLEQIKQELGYFAPGGCKLNPGAMPNQIGRAGRPPGRHPNQPPRAETLLGLVFPQTFCEILSEFNGGTFVNEPLLGVPPVATALDLVRETRQARTYSGPPGWAREFVEGGADGVGNPFVLLLDRRDERDESPAGLFDAGAMQISEIVASDYLHFVWFIIQDVK